MVAVVKGLVVGAAAVNAGGGGGYYDSRRWWWWWSPSLSALRLQVATAAVDTGTSLQYNLCSSHDYASCGFKKG